MIPFGEILQSPPKEPIAHTFKRLVEPPREPEKPPTFGGKKTNEASGSKKEDHK
jgi:hypothetical protein